MGFNSGFKGLSLARLLPYPLQIIVRPTPSFALRHRKRR